MTSRYQGHTSVTSGYPQTPEMMVVILSMIVFVSVVAWWNIIRHGVFNLLSIPAYEVFSERKGIVSSDNVY